MAAAGNYKVPPSFDEKVGKMKLKSGDSLQTWTKKKKNQALAITLSLSGRARENTLEIAAHDLNTDTRMDVLLTKLDSVFKRRKRSTV